MAQNYSEINAEAAVADLNSVFYFYKRLIELRKQVPVITDGRYEDLLPEHQRIFAYARQNDKQTLLCVNNYYAAEVECVLPERFELSKAKTCYPIIKTQRAQSHQTIKCYDLTKLVFY